MQTTNLPVDDLLYAWADDQLIFAQSLCTCSELSGPGLDVMVAVLSIAQDCFAHAQALYEILADSCEEQTTADELVFFRDSGLFRNCPLSEALGDDWVTICVQGWLFQTCVSHLARAIGADGSRVERLSALARVIADENDYHKSYWENWLSLMSGWEETRDRLPALVEGSWPDVVRFFSGGVSAFCPDGIEQVRSTVSVFSGGRELPAAEPGDVRVEHTPGYDELIRQMQEVARSYPGGAW